MSLEFVFGQVPPQDSGGFHFPQVLRSGDIRHITASTKDELDARVMDFRSNNSLELGNVPKETNDYLCSKWPRLCNESVSTVADESPKDKTLRQRTTNWRYNRYAQSITELEDEATAETRAKICSTCSNNAPNRDGCAPCVAENDRVLFMIRQGRTTTTKVGGCNITGQDNETAAFLRPDMLSYAKKYKDELPAHCWMKELL